MKPRESTIQAKEFEAAALRRQLAQFDKMIGDLETIAGELAKQIAGEERRSGIDDPGNYAYSTVARAARTRRDNLNATIGEMRGRREQALDTLAELDDFFEALTGAGDPLAGSTLPRQLTLGRGRELRA